MSDNVWTETERKFKALVPMEGIGKRRVQFLAVLEEVTRHREIEGRTEWLHTMEFGRYITADECEELGIDLALNVACSAINALGKQLARGEYVKKRAKKPRTKKPRG